MKMKMWETIPEKDKEEYRKLILAFASLTEMFSQKTLEDGTIPAPFINSKFQETVFQKALHAYAEDIGNTSYDASLKVNYNGKELKFLVGIKTFGIASGDQKIAQFKSYQHNFSDYISAIENSKNNYSSKEKFDKANKDNYLHIAKELARIRNERIESSIALLNGFEVRSSKSDEVISVYHVLMPSKKNENPQIFVGETNYDKIDINKIEILGCTNLKTPTNFIFTDGNHKYKYTSADSQLYMTFNNKDIVVDTWNVKYASNAYDIFSDIADQVYGVNLTVNNEGSISNDIQESYSWSLLNKNDEVEKYSGFNSFYGVSSKLGKEQRENKCNILYHQYHDSIDENLLTTTIKDLKSYLTNPAKNNMQRQDKEKLREKILNNAKKAKNIEFYNAIIKMVYRPINEVYIPIPNSKNFHQNHPKFFNENLASYMNMSNNGKRENRHLATFNLIFEPSGDKIPCYITQDNGKAIESTEKQSKLGEWILRKVFQLKEYEPLTKEKMNEIEINCIRLFKVNHSNDIHIQFIWIDKNNLPSDYIE